MAKNNEEEYRVKLSKDAKTELNEIYEYIAQQNPQTAIKIIRKIKEKIDSLDHFPARGAYVPELLARNIKDYRQLTEHPWRIIYKIDNNIVNVLTIIDSRRNLQDILIRKFLSWEKHT